jgi:hypothetical protein
MYCVLVDQHAGNPEPISYRGLVILAEEQDIERLVALIPNAQRPTPAPWHGQSATISFAAWMAMTSEFPED